MAVYIFRFRTISRRAFAGLFSYARTHPVGGVDVPVVGHLI